MWTNLSSILPYTVSLLVLAFIFISLIFYAILAAASSSNLANFQIPVSEAGLPVIIFTLITSLSVLVPIISGADRRPTGAQFVIRCATLAGTPWRSALFWPKRFLKKGSNGLA
jgi:hypothetical protein